MSRIRMIRRGVWVSVVGVALVTGAVAVAAYSHQRPERLVIHEWGTFTSLQDEAGRTLTGINTDDEPVPHFVHRLADLIQPKQPAIPIYLMKGMPPIHHQLAMRLETPVVYFYPPEGTKQPLELDFKVAFRGGWLSEYYPNAAAVAPGLKEHGLNYSRITPETVGELQWKGLTIGGTASGPETDAEVWLAPRRVAAASVRTPAGESERYLFYRGVGNIHAPLTVVRDGEANVLNVFAAPKSVTTTALTSRTLRALWLADIRADGTVAFASREGVPVSTRGVMSTFSGTFASGDYSTENMARLRESMHAQLVADGLFADEAQAMLDTWQHAYFQSPGLRLFFLLPQNWTDDVLPVETSVPAEIVRTMMGRIELVTPRQRELIATVAKFEPVTEAEVLSDLPVENPARTAAVAAYDELGRFRAALLLDAQARDPQPGLKQFLDALRIRYAGK